MAFLTALADAAPAARSYHDDFAATVKHSYAGDASRGLGILRAVAQDIEAGDLYSVQQLAASEVFSDFIDMAQHLCDAGYDAPAASLAGAVLEEGLRKAAAEKELKGKSLESSNDLLFQAGALTPATGPAPPTTPGVAPPRSSTPPSLGGREGSISRSFCNLLRSLSWLE